MRTVYWLALALVVVGAVNWGLVGIAQFDLVAALFGGQDAVLSRIVYALVGLAGVALAGLSFGTAGAGQHAMRTSRS
jgi:uncharacterized membrane protein YuzA (DUF378 family)